jgi:hypothetical protein
MEKNTDMKEKEKHNCGPKPWTKKENKNGVHDENTE